MYSSHRSRQTDRSRLRPVTEGLEAVPVSEDSWVWDGPCEGGESWDCLVLILPKAGSRLFAST